MKKSYLLISFCFILFSSFSSYAQTLVGQDRTNRVVTTAVPFLTISPDARAAGMGDLGAATSPDLNSQHWNAAKYAFIDKKWGVGLSYTPWLNKLINDMYLFYLPFYVKVSKNEAFSASMRYFDLGDVELIDEFQIPQGVYNPKEYAFDAAYSRRLSNSLSIAGTGRFIYSNLIGNIGGQNAQARAGVSGAVDISAYGQKAIGKSSRWSYGLVLSNIGAKLTYSGNEQKDFLPMNFRLGTALTKELDPYNKFTFAVDFNKLMVPSPQTDAQKIQDARNVTMLSGMVRSFGDAPGGISEELKEVMMSFGAEYWYNNMFAGRLGYFHENQMKGNRKYMTFGLGLRYKNFGLDAAYLVPIKQNNPLAETIRFSLLINLEGRGVDNNASE